MTVEAAGEAPVEEPALTPVGDPLRILPIAADLLPAEIVEARRYRRVRRIVIAGLAGFTALLAGGYGVAAYRTGTAHEELTRAQDRVQALLNQQKAYSEVVSTQAESKKINDELAALFGNDLPWPAVFAAVRAAAPEGVRVTGYFGRLATTAGTTEGQGGAAGSGGDSGAGDANQLPSQSTEKLVGTITITGSAPDEQSIAAYVDALSKIKGLANPFVSDATDLEGRLQFTVRFDLTAAALGGRFATKNPTPGGG